MSYFPPPFRIGDSRLQRFIRTKRVLRHHSIRPFTTISAAKIEFFCKTNKFFCFFFSFWLKIFAQFLFFSMLSSEN